MQQGMTNLNLYSRIFKFVTPFGIMYIAELSELVFALRVFLCGLWVKQFRIDGFTKVLDEWKFSCAMRLSARLPIGRAKLFSGSQQP